MKKPIVLHPANLFFLQITEDEKYYYVAIDREERARAKSISGRVWSPEIRKWVYPKNDETLEALLREFADRPDAFILAKAPQPKSEASLSDSALATPPPDSQQAVKGSAFENIVTEAKAAPFVAPDRSPAAPSPSDALLELTKIHALLAEQNARSLKLQERLASLENTLSRLSSSTGPNSGELTDTLRLMLAEFEQRLAGADSAIPKICNDSRIPNAWLADALTRGSDDDMTIADICANWNLIQQPLETLADCEEKLKARLRECLDLGNSSKASLNDLCNDYYESVKSREQSKLLSAFRTNRNKLQHEAREYKPRRLLRYLHALTALAIVWPTLGKTQDSEASSEDDPVDVIS